MANKFVNYTGVQYLWKQIAGTFVKKDGSKVLSTNDFTNDLKTKLEGIEAGAQVNKIESITIGGSSYPGSAENKTVDITAGVTAIAKAEVAAAGHASYEIVDAMPKAETAKDNVMYLVKNGDKHDIYVRVKNGENYNMLLIDDTDADLSGYATTEYVNGELAKKVDKVEGKGLSTNDFTNDLKTKLDGIDTGAQVNVIETVKVNGAIITPVGKAVDVTVPTKVTDLTDGSTLITDVQVDGESVVTSRVANIESLENSEILAAIKAADSSYTEVA